MYCRTDQIGSVIFAQHIRVTHRHTDHATCYICSNRPYLCSNNNNMQQHCTSTVTSVSANKTIVTRGRSDHFSNSCLLWPPWTL